MKFYEVNELAIYRTPQKTSETTFYMNWAEKEFSILFYYCLMFFSSSFFHSHW